MNDGGETTAGTGGLLGPHRLGNLLPAIYRQRAEGPGAELLPALVDAWDELLAPVFVALDSLDAYFDPGLTPPGFVDWLGRWVGLDPTQKWPLERRRARIARAVWLFLWWGTRDGIIQYVASFTGLPPERIELLETGGIEVSLEPRAQVSWTAEPRVVVRVSGGAEAVDRDRLEAIVAAAKPAHVLHEVEVVG